MNAYQVRINMNHMRSDINRDYISVKDLLARCVIANMAIIHNTIKPLDSIVMEDFGYNQLLKAALYQFASLPESFEFLGLGEGLTGIALDIYTFIEEFMVRHHKPNKSCYVFITIDSGYHLVVSMKDM